MRLGGDGLAFFGETLDFDVDVLGDPTTTCGAGVVGLIWDLEECVIKEGNGFSFLEVWLGKS